MSDNTQLELQRSLGRIEAKVEEMHRDLLRLESVKARVSKLESQRNYAAGFVAAISVVVGYIAKAYLTK